MKLFFQCLEILEKQRERGRKEKKKKRKEKMTHPRKPLMNTRIVILHNTSILNGNPENIKSILKVSVFVIVWALLSKKNLKIYLISRTIIGINVQFEEKILIYMHIILYVSIYSV